MFNCCHDTHQILVEDCTCIYKYVIMKNRSNFFLYITKMNTFIHYIPHLIVLNVLDTFKYIVVEMYYILQNNMIKSNYTFIAWNVKKLLKYCVVK